MLHDELHNCGLWIADCGLSGISIRNPKSEIRNIYPVRYILIYTLTYSPVLIAPVLTIAFFCGRLAGSNGNE
jgi:hypothetical protein